MITMLQIVETLPLPQVHHHLEWTFYLFGAVLALAMKWFRWTYNGSKQGKTVKESTLEWFAVDLLEDRVSWITTIGVVWVFGVVYLNRVPFLWMNWIQSIPIEESIAFLFGSMMEWVAPAVVKWVVAKLPIQL